MMIAAGIGRPDPLSLRRILSVRDKETNEAVMEAAVRLRRDACVIVIHDLTVCLV